MPILELLQANSLAFSALVAILGLMVGSFLNVVIYRLPVMLERSWRIHCRELLEEPTAEEDSEPFDLARPRSRCPNCGHEITALENIPVISYLFLRGRCSACHWRIPLRYPLIEATTAILSAVIAWRFGVAWETAAALILTWALISLAIIDFDHQLLPDTITLPLLWLGLFLSLFGIFTDSDSSILGAVFGYLSLWVLYKGHKALTSKEGMGYGDFKLLALLGAWMGWQSLPAVILLSSLVGATVGISLIMLRGRDRNIPIPFGPYLAAAGWIVLIWGEQLSTAYLRWTGLGS